MGEAAGEAADHGWLLFPGGMLAVRMPARSCDMKYDCALNSIATRYWASAMPGCYRTDWVSVFLMRPDPTFDGTSARLAGVHCNGAPNDQTVQDPDCRRGAHRRRDHRLFPSRLGFQVRHGLHVRRAQQD